MPPIFTAKEIMKRLEKAWFVLNRSKWSHHVFVKDLDERRISVIVPVHNKDCPPGTFKNILRQAEMSLSDFKNLQ